MLIQSGKENMVVLKGTLCGSGCWRSTQSRLCHVMLEFQKVNSFVFSEGDHFLTDTRSIVGYSEKDCMVI